MRKICAKMVPMNLTEQQQDAHFAQFLTSKCITVMPQPSYSPDLAPCDFFLFQKVKKGTPFLVNRRHPEVCNTGLKRHPTNAFQECYNGSAGLISLFYAFK
jgi:hypothetical protein